LLNKKVVLSHDQILKYFEVRLVSLAIVAIGVFFICLVLVFFFILRREYLYAVAVTVLMVVTILGAIKLLQYARTYREELKRHKPNNKL
jgi:membrane protein YdbS with pleckstrin-like domain